MAHHHHHTDDHPRRNEEEYFVRENAELVKRLRAALDEQRRSQERTSHYMKCPNCGADLVERTVGGVTVDGCRECGGMWLNQGEIALLQRIRDLPAQDRDAGREGPVSRIMHDILDMFHRQPHK